ncbi:MAG: hypothetical protein WBD80_11105 [Xanthobacteraceae bacterium]
MQRRVCRILLVTAFMAGAWGAGVARAAEWRYCLATAPGQHTVYMSAPFSDHQSMETVESEFGSALDRAAMQHNSVQCPLGNAQSIASMKAQAIQYNQASGNKVVQLNWRP